MPFIGITLKPSTGLYYGVFCLEYREKNYFQDIASRCGQRSRWVPAHRLEAS